MWLNVLLVVRLDTLLLCLPTLTVCSCPPKAFFLNIFLVSYIHSVPVRGEVLPAGGTRGERRETPVILGMSRGSMAGALFLFLSPTCNDRRF